MPKVWQDVKRNIIYIETETMLGPQPVCDEYGILNLEVEMRQCRDAHESAMLYAGLMKATAVMEIKPISFDPKEQMEESFDRKRKRRR